jgi:allantoinase
MDNRRYDYSPIISRPKIEWPNHGRIALWVAPNIEYFHFDKPIRGSGSNHTPDVPGYTLRDYGSRVGVFRIMDVLDKYGIRASVLLNAEVCEHHPPIIEEGNKRNWEWLGHGMTNSVSMLDYKPEEERSIIHNVKEIITKNTGTAPKGWLGPGLGETNDT